MISGQGEQPARMSFGLGLYTGQGGDAGGWYRDLAPLAAAAESAGFGTFWVSEHHGWDDGYLPSALVALAAAAQATSSIQLGAAVVLPALTHPLRLAEDAAVVDQLSGGRLVLGLGAGYVPAELAAFGVPMRNRGRRLTETVEILRLAWTARPFSYPGRVWPIDAARVTPPPAHRIPIWLGGYADAALERAARLADGHLVGRGSPELIERADGHLAAGRNNDDSFTFGVMVSLVGDDPAAGRESARAAYSSQQLGYERVQAHADAYAGQVNRPAGRGLDLGAIDAYIQVAGNTAALVDGLVRIAERLSHWRRVHLAIRAVFPREPVQVVLDRIGYLGLHVLPAVRTRLASEQGRR